MARKLFHPVDNNSKKNPSKHKEFGKPVFDSAALRIIGKAFDLGVIKEEVA